MVKLDKMFGNCQTQTKAAELSAHGGISLLEWCEQGGKALMLDSNAVVGNFEMETARFIIERADANLATWRREFDRVID
jgi:hypothetical protein